MRIFIALILGELLALNLGTVVLSFCAFFALIAAYIFARYRKPEKGFLYLVFVLSFFAGIVSAKYNENYRPVFNRLVKLEKEKNAAEYTFKVKYCSLKEDKLYIEGGGVKSYIDDISVRRGDTVKLYGSCKKIKSASNPGCFDPKMYYRARGISHSFKAKKFVVLKRAGNIFEKLKDTCISNVKSRLEDKEAGLVIAMLLGNRDFLDKDIYELFQNNGIAHILAISGLHISLIGLSIYNLLRKKFFFSYGISGIAASIFLLLYTNLIGDIVGAYRAVAMLMLAFFAAFRGKNYDLLSSLSFVASLMCVQNPYTLYQTSFILSFGAVLSIGITNEYILRPLCDMFCKDKKPKEAKKLKRYITGIFLPIGIQILNLPIIAYFFFYIPLYALLLNIIVLALMSILCISGFILMLPNIFILSGLASANVKFIVFIYISLCKFTAGLYNYRVLCGRPDILKIILYYAFIASACYFLKKGKKALSLSLFCVVLSFGCLFIELNRGEEIVYIDVGQGDGIYIHSSGKNILIDGGSTSNKKLAENTLRPFLLSKKAAKIDLAFITHADADHYNGVLTLIENKDIKVETMVLPFVAEYDEDYDKIKEVLKRNSVNIGYIRAGDEIKLKNAHLSCFSPDESVGEDNTNEQSIMLLFKEGEFTTLLTGDADEKNERKFLEKKEFKNKIDSLKVLKAGHHGSFTSTCEDLLCASGSEYAILSYGEDNHYGHPSREVLARLEKYKVKVYETAVDGAVIVRIKKNGFDIKGFRRRDENNQGGYKDR